MKSTFADLGVSAPVARVLERRGLEHAFAVQESVIPDALEGHDILAQSPTGSGKTLAFGIPLVESIEAAGPGPAGLILAPTRELASQIVDEIDGIARSLDIRVAAVYGGVGIHPQIKAARRADILVATPGRLVDLLDRRAITLGNVKVLILDEADRMLDMGFKPVVDRLVALTPADRQTMLFSATLEGEVGRIAAAYTHNPRRHEHRIAPGPKVRVEHRFRRVAHEDKLEHLVDALGEAGRGRTLVFVRTKRGADRLAKRLTARDVRVGAMHGDKSQSQRERALAAFETGRIDTLVATDVAARGIDVTGVTHVINFDIPQGADDYVHRIGRTARAGATGVGVTFVCGDQEREFVKMLAPLKLDSELEAGGMRAPAPKGNAHGGPRPHAAGSGSGHRGRRRRRTGAGTR